MENEWKEPFADDGVTLGPEEALRRETEKTRALKVERLQLKDTLEKLRAENAALKKNQPSAHPPGETSGGAAAVSPADPSPVPAARWVFFLLAFNLAAAGILLFFLLKQ